MLPNRWIWNIGRAPRSHNVGPARYPRQTGKILSKTVLSQHSNKEQYMNESILLEITSLHNVMILSTLIISSHDFALGFLERRERSHSNGDVFFDL